MTAYEYVSLRGPQFINDPRLTNLIAWASGTMSSAILGVRYGEAVGLKVLHILTLEQLARDSSSVGVGTNSGIQADVSQVTEGDLSITYRSNAINEGKGGSRFEELRGTQFGLELLTLIRGSTMCVLTRI
jgi:Protein of unknown function (DUF4054)